MATINYNKRPPKIRFRIRCPVCGCLCWDSMFNREHVLEAFGQVSGGRASMTYVRVRSPEYLEKVRQALVQVCRYVLRKLEWYDNNETPEVVDTSRELKEFTVEYIVPVEVCYG